MDIDFIKKILSEKIPSEDIYINEPMSKHTSFKIGGPADIFIRAKSLEQIEYVLNICNVNNIPLTIIGNGSNILVKDNGIRGIVLKVCMNNYKIINEEKYAFVQVDSGMLNARLAQILMEEGIKGFEFASGIPGTIGGAIRMNAGAYGGEIKDCIEETTYIDLEDDNKIKTVSKDEQDFSYRHSMFANKKAIIINAKFKFEYGDKEEIANNIRQNLSSRKEKQPIDMPSAGSTFKRGKDFITAKLIDECGLKGKQIGGAKISDKHAGFIINNGNASAEDVINLIKMVKETVYEKTGKEIEPEIEIIGE